MLSQHNNNGSGTTFSAGCYFALSLYHPFAVVLLLAFCLAESLVYYHICCFSSYCNGITSTWTPLRFPNYSEIMHLTNMGVTLTLMWCFSIRHTIAGMGWIFYKSNFNELARSCLSSHFAGGLITSSLFINEDMASGRGRSEVILCCLGLNKRGDCSDSGAL